MYQNHRLTVTISTLLLLLLLVMSSMPENTALSAPRAQTLPTAGPCDPATAYARSGANVREGPTPDYPRIEQLTVGEVRRVVGRHAGFRWWQIETSDGGVGWVWDSAVTVTGDVLAVPLVEAPPLNGNVPRTDAVWEMTGARVCLPTPAPTPSLPTATPDTAGVEWDYEDEGWALPLNISQAGAAAQPQVVALGRDLLLLWEDSFDGFAFSRRENGRWSEPVVGEFPFFTRRYETGLAAEQPTPRYTPQLVARTPDDVYAFWRDGDDNFFVSHVAAAAFGNYDAWTARQQLASHVVGMAAAVGGDGTIHLAYLQGADVEGAPAGIYVQRLEGNAGAWSPPQPLHLSGYYRLITADTANIEVAAAGDRVFVAWSEEPQERLWLARSTDGADSWEDLQEIDRRRPDDSTAASGPGAVRLVAAGDELHLSWQAGHEGAVCAQYHQWSQDGGATWETTERLESAAPGLGGGCLQDVFLLGDGDAIYLLGSAENSAYLYLWNDGAWTAAQPQQPLSGFTLEASGRQVTPGCGLDAIVHDGQLVVAACGQAVGQDIWLLSQYLRTHAAILAVTPAWSTPEPLLASASPDDTTRQDMAIVSPLLVEDGEGRRHAFWVERPATEAIPAESAGGRLYHALWQNGLWSSPQPLFAESAIAMPAVALTGDGRLVLLWSGGASGEITYSWAAAARAGMASEWTEPALLPAPRNAGSAPAIVVEPASSRLYAAYAIPLNEGRGIYLTSSLGAESWSEATLVFDAAEAGWERVDRPRLALAGPDELHLLFWRRSLPGTALAAELYYMRSTDGGATWSEPEAINSGAARPGAVLWSDLVVSDGRMVHVTWQEWDEASGTRTLWHRLSPDNGITWGPAARIGAPGTEPGAAFLLKDLAEGIHLVGLGREMVPAGSDHSGDWSLDHWQWVDETERWEEAGSLEIKRAGTIHGLAATFTIDDRLVALVAEQTEEGSTQLLSAERAVLLPAARPVPLPTQTPTVRPTESLTITPTPRPTEIPVFPTDSGRSNSPFSSLPLGEFGGMVAGAALALIAACLIVLVAIGVARRLQSRRP